jgi:hypothetical protein
VLRLVGAGVGVLRIHPFIIIVCFCEIGGLMDSRRGIELSLFSLVLTRTRG